MQSPTQDSESRLVFGSRNNLENEVNKVNAKTSTKGEVTINGLGVKFSTRKVNAALAV
jgi:hypothetical protein